jgi:hypothetical protein
MSVVFRGTGIARKTKQRGGEERIYRAQQNQAFPPKLGALGAWNTLKGPFKVSTEIPDTLEIRVWL